MLVLALAGWKCSAQPATRAERIQSARRARQPDLKPDEVNKPERFLRWLNEEKVLARISAGYNGLRAKLGGMVTGGGFGAGPEYFREDLLNGQFQFRASAQASTRRYVRLESEALLPSLLGGRLFAGIHGAQHNYSSLGYYGPGPDSAKSGRSSFRLEDVAVDGTFGVRPVRALRMGGSAGTAWFNVGPGRDEKYVSAERIYSAVQAPGIDRQTDFVRFGPFIELDYRDDPFGTRNGGKYLFQWTAYQDRKFGRYDFRRFDIDLQQYIGFFNDRRVIALRAHTTLTDTSRGNVVPFYLQPVAGGSDELRGFRPFRFRDDNMLVLNGEYRWEVFTGLDMALFVDAGKVFGKWSQLNVHNLESSVGFGFRFNAANHTFLRLDVGFSHEGFQVWFKFNDVFGPRALGTAGTHPVI